MIILYLTCANEKEAKTIGQALLDAKLVACVRRAPVHTINWWQGKQEQGDEILLMMESREDYFDKIEQQVRYLHSYDEPALVAVPVVRTTKGVEAWLDDSLGSRKDIDKL